MRGGSGWGGGWIMGTFLLGLGVLVVLGTVFFTIRGFMLGNDVSVGYGDIAIAMAFSGIALIGAGASLRWCGSCCGDDCEWDDEGKLLQIKGTKSGKA